MLHNLHTVDFMRGEERLAKAGQIQISLQSVVAFQRNELIYCAPETHCNNEPGWNLDMQIQSQLTKLETVK